MATKAQPKSKAAARLYFAYGAALDRETRASFNKVHPGFALPSGRVAEALGVEIVFDAPSKRWLGRVAALHPKKGASVFGELIEVPLSHWALLADFEGAAASGERVEKEVRVKVGTEKFTATAFTVQSKRATLQGPVSEPFVRSWARGVEQARLPKAYVEQVQAEALIVEKVQAAGRKLHLGD